MDFNLYSSSLDWSLMLLVKNARLTGKDTYPETVKAALGRPGYILVTVSLLAYTFGSKSINSISLLFSHGNQERIQYNATSCMS